MPVHRSFAHARRQSKHSLRLGRGPEIRAMHVTANPGFSGLRVQPIVIGSSSARTIDVAHDALCGQLAELASRLGVIVDWSRRDA